MLNNIDKSFSTFANILTDKYAVIALTGPDDHPRIYHAFLYLFDLVDNGIQADLFLDGAAVKSVDELEKNPSDIIRPLYDRAMREGLIKEACGFCANAFKVKDIISESNVKLSQDDRHISIGKLVKDGYRIVLV